MIAPQPLNLDQLRIDPAWALRIPPALAMRRKVLPLSATDDYVYVACLDEGDRTALQAVERYLQRPIQTRLADRESLARALERIYGGAAGRKAPLRAGTSSARREPEADDTVSLCDELLYAAMIRQASDIHIDPERESLTVRLRVDGELETYRTMPAEVHSGMVSRLKVMAGMDIAEKRAAQDGRFSHEFGGGREVDVRVATLPTRFGERMTLRLLALQTGSLTLEKLGMSTRDLQCFEQAIHKPHGMILLTGPTGSGKSTTLYAAIRRLIASQSLNVITIEDPVEYEMDGVAQVEVDAADKVSFGKALRSVLRHDPDVVMIGEIRDRETADIAIKAALTGHLVFSTLHTNSAASAITRLHDMQVERYLIGATMRLAVAQRLVRRACGHCREPRELTASEAIALGRPDESGRTVFEPAGCLYCANRGFVGRMGLFEMVAVDEAISRQIADGANEAEITGAVRQNGTPRLVDDAWEKVVAGETTVGEVLGAVTVW